VSKSCIAAKAGVAFSGRGSGPDLPWEVNYSAPPGPLAGGEAALSPLGLGLWPFRTRP